jgi:hypothetical protein
LESSTFISAKQQVDFAHQWWPRQGLSDSDLGEGRLIATDTDVEGRAKRVACTFVYIHGNAKAVASVAVCMLRGPLGQGQVNGVCTTLLLRTLATID